MTAEEKRIQGNAYRMKRYHIRMKDPVYRAKMAKHSREASRRYWATEKGKAIRRAGYARWAAKPEVKERIRQYQKDNRKLWRYGITRKEADALIKKQKAVCAICKLTPKRWCVDHDHATGKFRGLLCSTCNAGLGGLRDSINNLKAAISYLEKHERQL